MSGRVAFLIRRKARASCLQSILRAAQAIGSSEIAADALCAIFGAQGGSDSLVEGSREHGDRIDEAAIRHCGRDAVKLVKTADFELPWALATDSVN